MLSLRPEFGKLQDESEPNSRLTESPATQQGFFHPFEPISSPLSDTPALCTGPHALLSKETFASTTSDYFDRCPISACVQRSRSLVAWPLLLHAASRRVSTVGASAGNYHNLRSALHA